MYRRQSNLDIDGRYLSLLSLQNDCLKWNACRWFGHMEGIKVRWSRFSLHDNGTKCFCALQGRTVASSAKLIPLGGSKALQLLITVMSQNNLFSHQTAEA